MDSKALIRTKSHVTAKLKANILSQCPHYFVAGHNKHKSKMNLHDAFNLDNTSEMFETFPYISDLPKPLLPPNKISRDSYGREDLSMQLIYTKAKIQDDVNRYLELYKKHSNTLNKIAKKNIEWEKDNNHCTTLPRYMAETAEILECDPDCNFSGSYNWYYSHGTLDNISYEGRNILIFPYSEELIVLPIDFTEDSLLKPDYKNATKATINENIFQIVSSIINNNGRILARYKNDCILYNIFNMDIKKLQILEIGKQYSEVPYISADLDPLNLNSYCTANVNRIVNLWDLTKSKSVLSGNIPVTTYLEDNWASLKYDIFNSNFLTYVDRHCVHYFDIRMPIERPTLTMCPKGNLEDCENLSSFAFSYMSSYFTYVGSNHSLCLLDNRYPNKCVVKKWTHQFKSSPLFTNVCIRDNMEFVIIASQFAGETSIILNKWISTEETPETCSTPFSPPSCIETLKAAQFEGNCLSPHLRNRLLLCNTGCTTTVHKQSGDIVLLTQNSVNDIFYQGIGHEKQLDLCSVANYKSLQTMKKWEERILKSNYNDIHSPLVVTKRTDACEIFRNFTNPKLHSLLINEQNPLLEYLPKWKRPMSELNSFVDIFAPELLAPWEIIEDTPLVPITAAPHQKVLSWLGMTEESTKDSIVMESNNLNPSVFEIPQVPITSQDPDKLIEHDSESVQLFLPRVKTKDSSKKKIKTSQFIPGF